MTQTSGIVYLNNYSLEEIIRSGLEVYPVECTGILFGKFEQTENSQIWHIENTHPIQLAERERAGVATNKSIMNHDWSSEYEKIGEFHSHAHQGNKKESNLSGKISDADIKYIIENGYRLEIISNIYYPVKKRMHPINEKNLSLHLPLESNKGYYLVEIRGYFINKKRAYRTKIYAEDNFLKRIEKLN